MKILKYLATFIAASQVAVAAPTLVWVDPNPPEAGVVAYKVLRADWGSTNFVVVATATSTRWVVNLPAGQHSLAVVATGLIGDSPASTNLNVATAIAVVDLHLEDR